MAIATSLYCPTQLHSKTFLRQLFPGACVTRKTFPCHKSTLKSSLLPPFAVAASSSSVQAEPRTTAATPAKVLPFGVAILGVLGLPDIGQILPDTHPNWKVAASSVFVEEAAGYGIGNLDGSLILQRPKVSPHKEAVGANLCGLLGSDPSVINLKAKTHEKVDSLGEKRSVAAHTVVLLMRK